MADKITPISADRRLADVIRQVKAAAVERDDVVVDMREADRARLELLLEELRPVVEDVPREADQFDLAISSGVQPRFWIDAVAHVHMGHDRRTYRFVRDTRLGRVVIAEGMEAAKIAESVSRYIAERMIERQRMLEGDMEEVRAFYARRDAGEKPEGETAGDETLPPLAQIGKGGQGGAFIVGLLWFVLGCIAGAGIVAAAFWDRIGALLNYRL